MFKVNNRNTRARCEICSKLSIMYTILRRAPSEREVKRDKKENVILGINGAFMFRFVLQCEGNFYNF